jgi:hypothetical protein
VRSCRRSRLGQDIGIAVLFDLQRQFGATRLDDAAIGHDVHHIGSDMVQQPLVMRDDERAEVGRRAARSPRPTTSFSASMSRPAVGLVEDGDMRGLSIAICNISLRFFSPPEKPSFTLRFIISSLRPSVFIFARASFRNSMAVELSLRRARLRTAFIAVRRKFALPTPGQFDRRLEREEQPGDCALFRLHRPADRRRSA